MGLVRPDGGRRAAWMHSGARDGQLVPIGKPHHTSKPPSPLRTPRARQVLLQDGIHVPWEGVLDIAAYALRVRREQMGALPQILSQVPEARVRAMQATLRRVWPRYTYAGVVDAEEKRMARRGASPAHGQAAGRAAALAGAAERDATATLLEVLRARLKQREARWERTEQRAERRTGRPTGRVSRKASMKVGRSERRHGQLGRLLEPAPGCALDPSGLGERSPEDDGEGAGGFVGRIVHGWMI